MTIQQYILNAHPYLDNTMVDPYIEATKNMSESKKAILGKKLSDAKTDADKRQVIKELIIGVMPVVEPSNKQDYTSSPIPNIPEKTTNQPNMSINDKIRKIRYPILVIGAVVIVFGLYHIVKKNK